MVDRPGKILLFEDNLSRSPNLMMNEIIDDNLLNLDKIIDEQKKDEVCIEIIKFITSDIEMKQEIKKLLIFDIKNHFIIEQDCLFYIESNSKFISRSVL